MRERKKQEEGLSINDETKNVEVLRKNKLEKKGMVVKEEDS